MTSVTEGCSTVSLSSTGNEFSTQNDHEKIEAQATPPHCFNLCQCAERSPGSSVWGHSKGYPGCHHEPFLNQFSFPLFPVPSILDMVLKTLNGNNRSSFTFNEAGYTAPSRLDRGSDEQIAGSLIILWCDRPTDGRMDRRKNVWMYRLIQHRMESRARDRLKHFQNLGL